MRCPSCYEPVGDDDDNCPHCGTSLSMWKPPSANPAAAGAGVDAAYAGFWARVGARLIDSVVVGGAMLAVMVGAALSGGGLEQLVKVDEQPTGSGALLSVLVYLVGPWLYYALMESSSWQATLGKRAIGARVTDLNGQRISFAHATGRYFATALCYITLYIGFLMAAFTARKQALHDMATNTVVTYADGAPRKSGCLVMAVVGLFMLMIVGILAAVAVPAYHDYMKKAEEMRAQMEAGAQAEEEVAVPSGQLAKFIEHADLLASAVEERYAVDGVLPESLEAAQVSIEYTEDTPRATIGPGGVITQFSVDASLQLAMTPHPEDDGSLSWTCAGDGLAIDELPARCQ
ncbi:MAG: RDD family protein [Gammaproteobacteria bacterium]